MCRKCWLTWQGSRFFCASESASASRSPKILLAGDGLGRRHGGLGAGFSLLRVARGGERDDGFFNQESVHFGNEWLIEQDRGDWTENRLIPAAVSFRPTNSLSMDLWHMVRSFNFDDAWTHDHVFGVFLNRVL
jgi:hypothetical protein